jgi:tetratricopeptide (TPR) repeat protein
MQVTLRGITRVETSRRTSESLGERVRRLRSTAGLTQSELAGDRFSKEYVSQIERGKTRPTRETIEWLARRLGVDAGFLLDGVPGDTRARAEAALARGEALNEAERFDEALAAFEDVRTAVAAAPGHDLELRSICGEWKALVRLGRVEEAARRLLRAREIAEQPSFTDLDRAEVLYRLGVCRYLLSSVTTALGLLNEALRLAERSAMPADRLVSDILHFRARCYRRQRDYHAAREDVERALELAEGLQDRRALGHLYFQASLLADREGHWVLARSYAERAKAQYEQVADRTNVGRLLNNLGALNFLLGKTDDAVRCLKDAFATALEVGSEEDAAQAVSSLAQVHLRTGDAEVAEKQARHALAILAGRADWLDEIGSAQLVLGRALLEQDRLDEAEAVLREADGTYEQLGSASHRAAAWVAQGDLAARRGDDAGAARLYRRAAEALQDVKF